MAKEKRVSAADLAVEIRRDFAKAFKLEQDFDYKFAFRASSLPFCSRSFVFNYRWYEEAPRKPFGYKFNFYVDIGTAVHEVIQTFLGMGNVLYGNWTCCGVTEYGRIGSSLCSVCGKVQKYEELAPRSVLGMHVDGVSVKYNAVLEFKTTSKANLASLKRPYPNHIIQASCYVAALNEENGWDLDKIIFVYLSRDNPDDYRIFVVPPNLDAYPAAKEQLRSAKEDLLAGVIPDRVCSKPFDGLWRSCPYTGICFGDPSPFLIPVEDICQKLLP